MTRKSRLPAFAEGLMVATGIAVMAMLGWAVFSCPAHAQQTAKVLSSCGTAGYTANTTNYVTMDTTGAACGSGGGGGGGGTSSAFGSTFPATGTAIGVKNGANMVNLTADGSNNLNINLAGSTAGALISGVAIDGWNPTEGTKGDSAYAGSGSASIVAILKGLYTAGTAPIPAGSNTIGAVTQSGTWNTGNSAVSLSTASSAAESCHVYKASSGTAYSLSGYAGQAEFIMVFNATSAPADGAVTPVVWAYVPAAGSWSINYGANPATFTTGVTACASSNASPLTKTAIATNNVFAGQVQ